MEFDLVFEGGGAKGAVFIGAMEEFEARGHKPKRIVGTSAGSIMGSLLAAGQDSKGLRRAMLEKRPDGTPIFASFTDVVKRFTEAERSGSTIVSLLDRLRLPFVPRRVEHRIHQLVVDTLLAAPTFREFFALVERGGIYEGIAFRSWIRDRLEEAHKGFGEATFEQLFAKTGSDLSIIVSDTDAQRMLVLNHRTAPKCPVSWAVRASASIPFVWQEVVWAPEWGTYRGRDIRGHRLVDGGLLSNFPMHLVATSVDDVIDIMGASDPEREPNIGFAIDEELEVEGAPPARAAHSSIAMSRPMQRIHRLVETMLNAHEQSVLDACVKNHEICWLPAKGYTATEFHITEARIQALIKSARKAAHDYFEGRAEELAKHVWHTRNAVVAAAGSSG